MSSGHLLELDRRVFDFIDSILTVFASSYTLYLGASSQNGDK